MSVVFICGSHPRHAYIARQIASTGHLSYLIIEQREAHLPTPDSSLSKDLKDLFNHHFSERERIENVFFGKLEWPDVPILSVSKDELNSSNVIDIISRYAKSLLLSYGCHKLDNVLLDEGPKHRWNCHGGLSPWYKGAITHFWPSYMLEPQMTGMTVHELTADLDAGAVVHQCVSPLVRGDTLHMLAARAVLEIGKDLPRLVNMAINNHDFKKKSHDSSGMLWRSGQWQPHHLDLIYCQFKDRIVDAFLDGKLGNKAPKIFRQFT
ncbi:formyltransferase family protein [Pseudoalteromonas sp.]|uniref:formyltransferase family protein n=1 Tax=Pseudoalteromonas sp. TaxID=53249 RepID=UPI00261C3933|nr:formyltransferase family protein [Pseudoalteromonas sp.]MCP4588298.1 methionyl-tRNA formyltransferase [Pseudoalteromonas sp.]